MPQTTLEDFFEIAAMPSWRSILLDIIKRNKVDLWKIDLSLIAEKYLQELSKMETENLEVPLNAAIICTILLKHKANKIISFFELTKEIEEELKEEKKEVIEYDPTEETRLDSFVENLKELTKKPLKKYAKKIHYVDVKKPKQDFKTILDFIDQEVSKLKKKTLFTEFKDSINEISPNDTFYSLLFMHTAGKINVDQSEFYGDFYIKKVI